MSASRDALRVETASVAVVRRRAAVRRTAQWIAIAWAAGIASFLVWSEAACCITPLVLLGLTAFLLGRSLGVPLVGLRAPGQPGALLVGDGAVEVDLADGRVGLLRDVVVGGWTETWGGRDEVVLETISGTMVRATVEDLAQAREVLRAAGVAPEQRAVTLRLGADVDATARAFFIFLGMVLAPATALLSIVTVGIFLEQPLSGASLAFAALTAFIGFGLWLVLRPLVSTTVRVGTDGVAVRRLLERYFVPRGEVRDVTARGVQIVIERARGPSLAINAPGGMAAAAVVDRIREALADRSGDAPLALERLDRKGKSAREWLRDLRGLTSGAGGYREATIEPRDLLDVVEDGAAPLELRIAAAAALSGVPEPETKARVRVAAQACVDESLRAAIELAAEGELEDALLVAEEVARQVAR